MPASDELDAPQDETHEPRRKPDEQGWASPRADTSYEDAKGSARIRGPHATEGQRRGGMTTKQRYGHEHFVEIGAKGGEAVRDKLGKDFYVEIGRRGGKHPKRHSSVRSGDEDERANG